MFNKLPKRSGNYHIRDNIEKLELQIKFRHVNSLLQLPCYEITENGFSFDPHVTKDSDSDNVLTTFRIKWQQKLLSPQEVELYKDLNNCTTDLHKKYHKLINAKPTIESSIEVRLRPSRKGKSKKRAKKQTDEKNVYQTNDIFTYVDEDNFKACEKDGTELAKHAEYMYIYAALSPDTQLVVLKWFPYERLLHIYPDFNDMQSNPYFIEIDTDYRHLYAYACANASNSRLKFNNELNISPILTELSFPTKELLSGRTHWQTDQDLHDQFDMPPKRMKRFVLLFEIRSVCSAAYQPLHVRFQVHVPEHCLLEEGPSAAATHSSFASNINGFCLENNLSYSQNFFFGYSFQLTLLCEEPFQEHQLLHIYFELISIDNWERERVEGYAHFATYLKAGREEQILQCLRPADSLLDALTRYFIGGRRKFNIVHFFTPPNNPEQLLHSRFQCRMINTGHLHIVCQRLIQRNCELMSPCKSRCSGMTLDDILKAFIQARERLEILVLQE